jgi:predicted Zn-dependent protease
VPVLLGLLLAEEKKLPEAAEALGNAVTLLPERPRVGYDYAVALRHLGRRAEAERQLLQAHKMQSRDAQSLYALAVLTMQDRQWTQALSCAEELAELAPGQPGPRQVIEQIQKELSAEKRPQ